MAQVSIEGLSSASVAGTMHSCILDENSQLKFTLQIDGAKFLGICLSTYHDDFGREGVRFAWTLP
jgi:hypothetical protein